MKRASFRNLAVSERLWAGIRRWRDAAEGNRLVEPGRRWQERWWWFLCLSVLGFVAYHFLSGLEDSLTYLFLVGLLAYPMAGIWMGLRNYWQGREIVTVVPVGNRRVRSEIIREALSWQALLLAGAAAVGWLSRGGLPAWEGAVKTMMGAVGMAGILISLICLFQWKWIVRLGWLLLGLFVIRSFLREFAVVSEAWLDRQVALHFWESGAAGWIRGAVLAGVGLVNFFYWFRRGTLTLPLDRHHWCEFNGADPEFLNLMELPVEPEGEALRLPVGICERILWRFLGPEERVIARISGICGSSGLCGILLVMGLMLGVIVVFASGLVLSEPYRSGMWTLLSASLFLCYVFGVVVDFGIPRSLAQVAEVEIGPHACVPAFQIRGMSLDVLKRLLWKDSLMRLPLASLAGALMPTTIFAIQGSVKESIPTWIGGLCAFFLVMSGLLVNLTFWNRALSCTGKQVLPFLKIYGAGGLLCFLAVVLSGIFFLSSLAWLMLDQNRFDFRMFLILLPIFMSWIGAKLAEEKLRDPASDLVKFKSGADGI